MRRSAKILLTLGGLFGATYQPALYFDNVSGGASRCFGTPDNGRISGAVRADPGPARVYCWFCKQALRTYVHAPVAAVLTAAYTDMAAEFPDTDFVLGETGWPWGGKFAPHKTHQNGLSVDFMVPLRDGQRFPARIWNRYGYDLEFDAEGRSSAGEIDFAAIDAHLLALQKHALANGGSIRRVILAPELQPRLSEDVRRSFSFNETGSWVRHDEHYHVDFSFDCAVG